jgi:hypothetical protein
MKTRSNIEQIQRGLRAIQSCRSFGQLQFAGAYANLALRAAYFDPKSPLPPTIAVVFRDKIQEALDVQRDKIRTLGAPRLVRHRRRKAAAC